MKVLVYGNELVAGRISPLLKEMGLEMVPVSGDMPGCALDCFLRNMTDIELAILDTSEEFSGHLCSLLDKVEYIPVALLVNNDTADWEWLGSCEASAYIPLEVGEEEFASRLQLVIRHCLPQTVLEKV